MDIDGSTLVYVYIYIYIYTHTYTLVFSRRYPSTMIVLLHRRLVALAEVLDCFIGVWLHWQQFWIALVSLSWLRCHHRRSSLGVVRALKRRFYGLLGVSEELESAFWGVLAVKLAQKRCFGDLETTCWRP